MTDDTHDGLMSEREYETRYDAFVREQPQACPERLMMHFVAERAEVTTLRAEIEKALRLLRHWHEGDDAYAIGEAIAVLLPLTPPTPSAETAVCPRCGGPKDEPRFGIPTGDHGPAAGPCTHECHDSASETDGGEPDAMDA